VKKFIFLLLIGCNSPEKINTQINQIEYYKDIRTNLCFVNNDTFNSNGFTFNIFTCVPCTPEVESLLKK